eukprot:TRINITY_DN25_c1_g1_i7.p1 TRINITY_DN25_c1_g1~~TRINITY_DN25_c1_g1_i7.p1  ORF type:complete len:579 (-),score=315.59 TRINITY_DN25_c1_g1_i7:560-2296(-)
MSESFGPNSPYGGVLCDLVATGDKLKALIEESYELISLTLNERHLCDIELLLNGGFSPLTGFMNQPDYQRVVEELRLVNGTLFPLPITLDVSKEKAESFKIGQRVALRDPEGSLVAIITIESIYEPDRAREAEKCFGANDIAHPAVFYLQRESGTHYIGGSIEGVQLPTHYDFVHLRFTPAQLREYIKSQGWKRIVAFQTRNPMHRSHKELTERAARDADANLVIHPVVGMTKPGDVDHYTRVRCYKEIMNYYPNGLATLSLLPLAMRMAGPREAIWHAIIRRNYGCSHFIVGRDHAGPGNNSQGKPFYSDYEAQNLVNQYINELGIKILNYQMVVYVEDISDYRCIDEVSQGSKVLNISGTELRRRLFRGIDIPEWFSFPAIVKLLRETYPPRNQQGFCLYISGPSGAGKSTLSNALRVALLEDGSRPVSLFDVDEINTYLFSGVQINDSNRDLFLKRVAYISSSVAKARGIAIVCATAPKIEQRQYARNLVSQQGAFIEVALTASTEIRSTRIKMGLYHKTNVNNDTNNVDQLIANEVYDQNNSIADVVLDTSSLSIKECVRNVFLFLEKEGYIGK